MHHPSSPPTTLSPKAVVTAKASTDRADGVGANLPGHPGHAALQARRAGAALPRNLRNGTTRGVGEQEIPMVRFESA